LSGSARSPDDLDAVKVQDLRRVIVFLNGAFADIVAASCTHILKSLAKIGTVRSPPANAG
jgi:hypothetical protein